MRRQFRSGLIAGAAEALFGDARLIDDDELAGFTEGPPADVLKRTDETIIFVTGGTQYKVRGIPNLSYVKDADLVGFEESEAVFDVAGASISRARLRRQKGDERPTSLGPSEMVRDDDVANDLQPIGGPPPRSLARLVRQAWLMTRPLVPDAVRERAFRRYRHTYYRHFPERHPNQKKKDEGRDR